MNDWVVNLRDDVASDPALVGGKAARLQHLARAGFTVPDTLIVTTAAFRAHLPHARPGDRPDAIAVQPRLAAAVESAVEPVFDASAELAVRSSAAAEDGAAASYAGQHETYYFIPPDGLTDAIANCWLSLWSSQAECYRRDHDAGHAGFAMAVMIQRMVQADCAGVCFTADPTGRHPDHAWIESTWGLGAALVDGRVSPDRLLLARSGRILRPS